MTPAHRYALYLAPPAPWYDVGSKWLGRCADTGRMLPRAADADPRIPAWTAEPRRYGLHATLKPPFRLREATSPEALDRATRGLAAALEPFAVPVRRRRLRGFLAWCLDDDEGARQRMRALADAGVQALEPFRAPPTPAEQARRLASPLGEAERAMLERWGYPYVFDTFTFHMTLTGRLGDAELERADTLLGALEPGALAGPMPVESISLYVQPLPDTPFVIARHYGLGAGGRTRDGIGAGFLPASAS